MAMLWQTRLWLLIMELSFGVLALHSLVWNFGINIQYNPVRKPWLKPMIERMFGIINRKLLEPIRKIFSNIQKKEIT